jgi:hypothetical protein
MDTTYERNAEVIKRSVEQLWFGFSDVKIVLGTVTLGGTTLVARLTAGEIPGATTRTMKASEGGKGYDIVFFSSLRAGGLITPVVAAAFDSIICAGANAAM